jgi:TfoX/Sxy family transcriptional regulator of competence genes
MWSFLRSAGACHDRCMGYDEELAERVRHELEGEDGLTERKMFGGIGFMLDGHMAVGVSGQGGLMLRVPPERTDVLLAEPHAVPFEMHGKGMSGWLRIDAEGVAAADDLARWVAVGRDYVRTMPPK